MTDFPEYFRNSCIDLRSFTEAINDELKALLYRRRYRARLHDSRSAAWEQYMNIADILGEISVEISSRAGAEPKLERRLNTYLKGLDADAEAAVFRDKSGRLHAEIEGPDVSRLEKDEKYLDRLSAAIGTRLCRKTDERPDTMELMEAEPLAATVGVAGSRKTGQSVSGDKGTYFKTEEGELCVLLSDGMGSGIPAAKESADTVKILSDFLKAGVDASAALKILGSVMLLRDGDTPCCATVDLLCADLFTGKTRLYKYGAAPSYLRQGGKIRRLTGESLAVSFNAPEVLHVRLKAGDCVLIVSDGATSVGDDEWIEELLQKRTDISASDIALEVLETAMRRCGCCDDITTIAVCVEERK